MHVVEDPDASVVGGEDEVVVAGMNDEVIKRHARHVVLQFLPVLAGIESEEQAELRPVIKKIRVLRVLAQGVGRAVPGQVGDDGRPGRPVVGGLEHVVGVVAVAVVVGDEVNRAGRATRRFDARDPRRLRQAGNLGRDVLERGAIVGRELDVAVVGSRVEPALAQGRLGERSDRGVIRHAVVERVRALVRGLPHDFQGAAIDAGRKVAEVLPGLTAIARAEEPAHAAVYRFRIMGRDDERRVPVGG